MGRAVQTRALPSLCGDDPTLFAAASAALGPMFSRAADRKRFRRDGPARAGKSSLMVALLRLVELRVGRITIDGVDIASVPLHVRTAYR